MPELKKPPKPRAKHLNTVLVSKGNASGKHADKRKQVKHKRSDKLDEQSQ